jgi:hypothetical protein
MNFYLSVKDVIRTHFRLKANAVRKQLDELVSSPA